jgi:uncharacterized protein (DUF58 family)
VLPDHLIQDLRYMEIYTGRRFPNLRAGSFRSRMRGPGFDFDEHRAYRAGDDVRRIDWNVTARLNAPYVRETHAERELNVMIAVDVSRSMLLGTGKYSKKEIQLLLAGCLVFSSLSDQINTGFLSFSDRVHDFYPPRRNRVQAWRFLEQLWAMQPSGGDTGILPAVRHLDSHFRQEGVVFLISDFLTAENLAESRELKILAARHDIIAVVIEDALETGLPAGDAVVELQDMETGRRRRVGLGDAQRLRYAEAMRLRRQQLVDAFYHVPMDYVFVRSDQRAVESLLNLFAVRRRM